jgi:hypothetical protein
MQAPCSTVDEAVEPPKVERGGVMRLTIGVRRGAASVALVAILGAVTLLARPAGAQTEIIVVWPSSSGKHRFVYVGNDGLRLGDRSDRQGPLTDATGASTLGKGHLDCVVQRQITDGPEGPGGLYRCSYLLRLAVDDLVIEGLDPHGPGSTRWPCLEGWRLHRRHR